MEDVVRGITKLMTLPFSDTFDEIFLDALPKRYAEPAEHLINARIELLSAFKSVLDKRIERLKEFKERVKEKGEAVKKEKVKVE